MPKDDTNIPAYAKFKAGDVVEYISGNHNKIGARAIVRPYKRSDGDRDYSHWVYVDWVDGGKDFGGARGCGYRIIEFKLAKPEPAIPWTDGAIVVPRPKLDLFRGIPK